MKALKARLRFLGRLFKTTAVRWSDAEGPRLGASFSFYATFSIFPLLLLALTVVGYIIGDDASARGRLLAPFVGPAREMLDRTLTAMQEHSSSRGISAAIGLASLLFSASGAFVELDTAINRIWCVPPRKSEGVVGTIRTFALERLSGFAIVAMLGLTLIASLVGSSLLGALADRAHNGLDLAIVPAIAHAAELAFSIALLSAVFTATFHFLPRTRPPIRDLVGGAVLTTVMLTILKEVFASYLSRLTSYSAYGVAGGVLALATWIYLSSQIILFGAQLTRIHAEMAGSVGACDENQDRSARHSPPRPPAPESAW
jgi:membrane protein